MHQYTKIPDIVIATLADYPLIQEMAQRYIDDMAKKIKIIDYDKYQPTRFIFGFDFRYKSQGMKTWHFFLLNDFGAL
jgi:hypothetical protein